MYDPIPKAVRIIGAGLCIPVAVMSFTFLVQHPEDVNLYALLFFSSFISLFMIFV